MNNDFAQFLEFATALRHAVHDKIKQVLKVVLVFRLGR